jgi:predicted NAD/FAD-binding protein
MTSCWSVHVFLPVSTITLKGPTQPISAAVWDTAPDKLFNEFPVRTLVQFMNNHNLLQVIGAPDWLTIGGGR